MPNQSRRVPYPIDLSDNEWEVIKPYIPSFRSNRGRKCIHSYREILNAIFYLFQSNTQLACCGDGNFEWWREHTPLLAAGCATANLIFSPAFSL